MNKSLDVVSRRKIINTARLLNELGLNRGTSGNLSIKLSNSQWLITPSGVSPEDLSEDSIVMMDFDGQIKGPGKPSSEWRFHRDIYLERLEIKAVVHTHSNYATALSCVLREIPAFHYMIAVAGGDSIRCAPYALFGSEELSKNAVIALKDRNACLLANHGMISIGCTIESALGLAVEVETLCQQYASALQLGNPLILTNKQMKDVLEQFKTYRKSN
jgi:L-fuculose-phosphate aldolase